VASPIGTPNNLGTGVQQLKAQFVQIAKAEVRAAMSAGIGLAPGIVYQVGTNFALSTSPAAILTVPVTVPLGMTSACVAITARVWAVNPGAADWLYASVNVGGYVGEALPLPAGASGGVVSNTVPLTVLLSGLGVGASFNVAVWANSFSNAWAANAGNTVELTGSVQWFR
jgi:hypothetical protein